MLLIALEVYN